MLKGAIALIAVIILATAGYFFWQNQQLREYLRPQLNTSPILVTSTPAASFPNQSQTSNWKIYKNKKLGVSFKYPPSYSFKELDNYRANEYSVSFSSEEDEFSFSRTYLNPRFKYGDLGVEPSKEITLGQRTWNISTLEGRGYCDAGQCSGPRVNYGLKINDWAFGFTFYEISEISDEQELIISTFSVSDNLYSDGSLSWESGLQGFYNVGIHWPGTWKVKENSGKVAISTSDDWTKGRQCFGMEISSNDGKAVINLDAKCTQVSSDGINCPSDLTIIEGTLFAPNPLRGRYYDADTKRYIYSNVERSGEKRCSGEQVLTIGTASYDRFIHFDAALKYSGSEESKEEYLEKADNIIRSLLL